MNLFSDTIQMIPLTLKQIALLLYDVRSLEEQLKLNHSQKPLSEDHWRTLSMHYHSLQTSRENREWLTLFHVILIKENVSIGNIFLTGGPDGTNALFVSCIIYGEEDQSKKSEYLLEALKIIYRWSCKKAAISRLIANCGNEMVIYGGEQHDRF